MNNQKPNSNGEKGLGYGGLKLLIDSLADLIAKLRIDLLLQGKELFAKIREVNDSVDIIAREIQRQAEGSKKSQ
ncbi:MAG: hypothetical protein ACXWIU_08385 [Limisphaerales bacterium]